MRKILSGLLLLALLAVPVFAAGAGKATGGVGYTAGGLERRAEFNVHESKGNQPAKGIFNYHDANGNWYQVDVEHVKVDGDMAYFAGEVVKASDPTWLGQWLSAAMYDGGTPGRNGDKIWGTFTDMGTAMDNVDNMNAPGSSYPIENGNLVVH
jgi:hypothetical protein